MKQPQTPTGPSIEPSKPLQEKLVVEEALERVAKGNTIITVPAFFYLLETMETNGISIDKDGFVRKNGEYTEGYVYDTTQNEPMEPADNPIEYFTPASEADDYFKNCNPLHLSDVHTFFKNEDGELCFVKDDNFNLSKFSAETGLHFGWMMNWSKTVIYNDLREEDDFIIFDCSTEQLEETYELFCVHCGEYMELSEWDKDPETGVLVCPECSLEWQDGTVHYCENCGWTGILSDYEDRGEYWEPYCQGCTQFEILTEDDSPLVDGIRVMSKDDEMSMITHTDRADGELPHLEE